MDRIAREFVGLVLELGEHDPGYVDAYYGPPQWQEQARARERELASIAVDAERLAAELALIRPEDAWEARRVRFLVLQLEALQRVALPTGEEFRV